MTQPPCLHSDSTPLISLARTSLSRRPEQKSNAFRKKLELQREGALTSQLVAHHLHQFKPITLKHKHMSTHLKIDLTKPVLPPVASDVLKGAIANVVSVYGLVVDAEAEAIREHRGTAQDRLYIRIIGFLIIEFLQRTHIFGSTPVKQITNEITSRGQIGQDQFNVICELGEHYYNHLLRPCMWSAVIFRDVSLRKISPPDQGSTAYPSQPSIQTFI